VSHIEWESSKFNELAPRHRLPCCGAAVPEGPMCVDYSLGESALAIIIPTARPSADSTLYKVVVLYRTVLYTCV
jgi:hypothetical protein